MIPQDGAPELAAALPAWWPESVLWLGLALLGAVVAAALGAWALVRRIDLLRADLRALERLEELQRTLSGWLGRRDDLDLRRIEHLLIDLRDGARRTEELLLRAQEHGRGGETDALVPVPGQGLGERVVNRLLALGYEKVELVTSGAELEALSRNDGEILLEARREGVLCKGRVRIRAGRIDAVHLQPAFPVFP